jgi:TPR repeat protein
MRITSLLTGVLVAVLLSASSAFAGAFEDAVAAYNQQDYATALRLFQSLAEQGDAKAQIRLASMYGNGDGVPKDAAEGVKWLRKAAEQGDALGQTVLGIDYEMGEGVPRDYAEGVKWLRKGAEQGNVLSQFWLSFMYENGSGGVPQDYVLAYMWLILGAAHAEASVAENAHRYGLDLPKAPVPVPDFTKERDKLAAKLTPDQIAEAQRLAREWKPRSEGPKSLFERLMDAWHTSILDERAGLRLGAEAGAGMEAEEVEVAPPHDPHCRHRRKPLRRRLQRARGLSLASSRTGQGPTGRACRLRWVGHARWRRRQSR